MTLTLMQRKDFNAGLESLLDAYKGAEDQLVKYEPSTAQRVVDVLSVWSEFLSEEMAFIDSYDELVWTETKSVTDHEEAVQQLAVVLQRRDSTNIELWAVYVVRTLRIYLNEVNKTVSERWSKIPRGEGSLDPDSAEVNLQRRTVGLLVNRIEQIELSHRLREANRAADKAVRVAQTAAEDARTAAGVASRSKLTTRFAALAKKHFWAATLFRVLTAAGVVGGIWAVLHIPVAEVVSGTDTATAEAILRVSLLAGVLGLATYFGRQAAYHRDVSTWASTIKEQLLTFDGYIDPVNDDDLRDQMRAAFAARVFGSTPDSKEEPGLTLSSPMLSEVAALFAKASSPRP
jgi:hypothetical protein